MNDVLSATFAALADPTRRAMLARLAHGPATINQLAEPFAMTLPSVSRHVKVLEAAGLITKARDAQFRTCTLDPKPLEAADSWLDEYRQYFGQRLDRLEVQLKAMVAQRANDEESDDDA